MANNRYLICILLIAGLTGCANLLRNATQGLADDLALAVLNQNDIETVRDGVPAYLLMVDAMIADRPDHGPLLNNGARMYAAYASAFVEEPARARHLTAKALDYGRRALCAEDISLCAVLDKPLHEFQSALEQLEAQHVTTVYTYSIAWAGNLRANPGNWNTIAGLPKLKAVLERLVKLDAGYDHGGSHLLLGVIEGQLPPALGGRPEQARRHFEAAIRLSDGRNLMVKVLYALTYARLMFNRELHDGLLNEVLNADPGVPGLILMNTLAQTQARELLDSGGEFF